MDNLIIHHRGPEGGGLGEEEEVGDYTGVQAGWAETERPARAGLEERRAQGSEPSALPETLNYMMRARRAVQEKWAGVKSWRTMNDVLRIQT